MPSTPPDYDPQTVLLVVDVQDDFADPDGSLYVEGGEDIVGIVNEQIAAARTGGATVVTTQDWHPPESPHFEAGGGTWPVHCVRGTWGAALHPELDREADLIVRKGTAGEDGYSAFTIIDPDTAERRPTGLAGYLAERNITTAVVVGLATDVCVKATALEARELGLDTTVLWEASRPVEVEPGDTARALDEMRGAGVHVVGAAR